MLGSPTYLLVYLYSAMECRPADPGAPAPADSVSLFLVSVLGMEHAW